MLMVVGFAKCLFMKLRRTTFIFKFTNDKKSKLILIILQKAPYTALQNSFTTFEGDWRILHILPKKNSY